MRRCPCCGRDGADSDFWRGQRYCKPCSKAKVKHWRAAQSPLPPQKIEWLRGPLREVPIKILAENLGVGVKAVYRARMWPFAAVC